MLCPFCCTPCLPCATLRSPPCAMSVADANAANNIEKVIE